MTTNKLPRNQNVMIRLVFAGMLVVSALVWSGCKPDEDITPTVDITGNWRGTFCSPSGAYGNWNMALTQNETSVTGNGNCGSGGPYALTGTFIENHLSLSGDMGLGPVYFDADITGSSFEGTYSGGSGTCFGGNGVWEGRNNTSIKEIAQPFAGTYIAVDTTWEISHVIVTRKSASSVKLDITLKTGGYTLAFDNVSVSGYYECLQEGSLNSIATVNINGVSPCVFSSYMLVQPLLRGNELTFILRADFQSGSCGSPPQIQFSLGFKGIK